MNLKTISIVSGVLVAAAIAVTVFDGGDSSGIETDPLVGKTLLSSDQARTIEQVEIKGPAGSPVKLHLDNGKEWLLEDGDISAPADVSRLRRMIKSLVDGSVLRFVTANPDRKASLNLDKAEVTLNHPGGSSEFRIGRNATGGGTFIEVVDSGRAYLVEGYISADTAISNWRDKTPFSFEADDIQKIEIGFPDNDRLYKFERTSAEGDYELKTSVEGKVAQADKVAQIANRFASLNYQNRINKDIKELEEAEPYFLTISLTDFQGNTSKTRIGRRPEGVPFEGWTPPAETEDKGDGETSEPKEEAKPPAGSVYLISEISDKDSAWSALMERFAFEVPSWTFEQLPTSIDDLLKNAPKPAEATDGTEEPNKTEATE